MIEEILKDIEFKLNITLDKSEIKYYTEGATESIVFSIEEKYLIKTMDELTYKSQMEFLRFYNEVDEFQKVICCNTNLRYICFKYIEGYKIKNKTNLDARKVISQIENIITKYKEYEGNAYGYIFDNKSVIWSNFLGQEIKYAIPSIKELDIPIDPVNNALRIIAKYNVKKYLIHGDFGTHNFLINEKEELKVIDPMPIIGDYLFDFYFAVLSSSKIFKDISDEEILKFFDIPYEYKKSLYIIVMYIRASRAYVYDTENVNIYILRYLNFKI